MGHECISLNFTDQFVSIFSLKTELSFLAKHDCLRFQRHLNLKHIKLYFSNVQRYNNNYAFL